jgi:molybdopterin-containing oxidoreductase family membrane subunit
MRQPAAAASTPSNIGQELSLVPATAEEQQADVWKRIDAWTQLSGESETAGESDQLQNGPDEAADRPTDPLRLFAALPPRLADSNYEWTYCVADGGADQLTVGTYLIVSVLFWYVGLIPDLAGVRDRARRRHWQVFFGLLCLGWRNSAIHWKRWQITYWILAGLALPLVVSVHSGVSMLFAVALEPGWHTTVYPPYFVLGAVFEGFAVVLLIAVTLRHAFSLHHLVTDRHLDMLAKLLLAFGLMTAYGYLFEAFGAWYSGDPFERETLIDRFAGTYAFAYWGAIVCNFVVLQAVWFRAVRTRPGALLVIAASVTLGMWLERFMLITSTLYRDFLPSSYQAYAPSVWEWSLFLGTVGLFFFLFFLFVRLLPMISIFELKEVMHDESAEAGR